MQACPGGKAIPLHSLQGDLQAIIRSQQRADNASLNDDPLDRQISDGHRILRNSIYGHGGESCSDYQK